MRWFHRTQAITLVLAIAIMWIPYKHNIMMAIASGIVGINALIVLVN